MKSKYMIVVFVISSFIFFMTTLGQTQDESKKEKIVDPFFEEVPGLGYQFRKDTFAKHSSYFSDPYLVYPKGILSKVSTDGKDGLIRSAKGDRILNKWGMMTPYFEKRHDDSIFRIIAIGGTQTAGWKMPDELTYPSILERMLNNKQNKKIRFQVLNAGRWGYNSCVILKYFQKEIFDYQPDLILLQSGGYGDTQLLNDHPYKNLEDYCNSPPKDGSKGKALQTNSQFFKKNVEQIMALAKKKGVPVALINHPFVFNEGKEILPGMKDEKEIKKFSYANSPWPQYDYLTLQKRAMVIDETLKQLKEKFPESILINGGLSVKSKDKYIYFAEGDLTPAGNRIVAYRTYLALNEKFKFHPKVNENSKDQNFEKNTLEIQFLNSLFNANSIEDITAEYCGMIHYRRCTHHREWRGPNYQFLNGIVSFTIGVMLNYPKQAYLIENFAELKVRLIAAINTYPKELVALPIWTLAQLSKLSSDKELKKQAKSLEEAAYKVNPLLKKISFQEMSDYYHSRAIPNPFLKKIPLKFILSFLNRKPTYAQYYIAMNKPPKKLSLDFFYSLYVAKPLLGPSIFSFAMKALPKEKASIMEKDWELLRSPYPKR
jgi:hypothetical protein